MDDIGDPDINTAAGMLRYLLRINDNGIAFVFNESHQKYMPLPKWMWGHAKLALDDAKQQLAKD